MPKTLRRHARLLGTTLLLTAGLVVALSFPAGATSADAFAVNQHALAWSCAPHPVFLGPARPAALAAARGAVAELEVATGRAWPITTDPTAADVTVDWDLTVRVGATGEVWLQADGNRFGSAQVVLDPTTADAELPGVLRHHLGHVAGLGHVTDPGQVMSSSGPTFDHFQAGDLNGLRGIGSSCR